MHLYRERTQISLLCLLLALVLGVAAFSAVATLHDVQNFQQQYSAVKAKDVSAIHPWMTIHVISHIYYVPENYLCHSLKVDDTDTGHRITLITIASRKKQPVPQVIHTIQQAILTYRKGRREKILPTPSRPGK